MLTTSMELETADEDIEYHFNGTGSKKLSFNLSDFKAMLAFCTDVHTDVVVHLDEPGKCATGLAHGLEGLNSCACTVPPLGGTYEKTLAEPPQ
jgi:hypothetical protein